MRHLYDNLKLVSSLVPATRTASANGTGVDTQGYNDAVLVVPVGDIDTTSGDETYAVKVQESDDNSTFADVTGMSVSITADNQIGMLRVSQLNIVRKRYLRAVLTCGGTTPSIPGGAHFILGAAESGALNND